MKKIKLVWQIDKVAKTLLYAEIMDKKNFTSIIF